MSDPDDDSRKKTIVVKKLAKSKAIGWSSSATNYKVDPLFRLGIEYKALRYIRLLGLNSPVIESVVLGKKILVTEFIEGMLISDIMKNCLNRNTIDGLRWIKLAGEKIGRIHADKSTLGDINPSSLIIRKGTLYITGAEQFGFRSGDPVWDIVSFISRGLKRTSNIIIAEQIIKEFLEGYSEEMTMEYMKKLINTKHSLELFYSLLTPTVAQIVKKEISNYVAN